ncbi:MAG: hypothetical protein EB027_04655, partial [Actinobacteria bacterium]|nr:hypothetical protein [Actinomycetota bacterium]
AYEVMYILTAPVAEIADVQSQLVNLGDSLAVVGSDGVWNVHVHVDDPAAAIAIGHSAGAVDAIKVSYLLPDSDTPLPVVVGVESDIAEVAVSAGFQVVAHDAFEEVTDDIVAAASRAGRSAALVLVAGAHAAVPQSAWQTPASGVAVSVLACHHLPQVLAALAVYDGNLSLADNVAAMSTAAAGMRCASVHQGRDGGVWTSGGWRTAPATDVFTAVAAAVDDLCGPAAEIVTIVYHRDLMADVQRLRETAAAAAHGCHVEMVAGRPTDAVVSIGVE